MLLLCRRLVIVKIHNISIFTHLDVVAKMNKICIYIDRFNDAIGRASSWLCLLMVLMMVLIVTLRYVFHVGSVALQESIIYINAIIFTFGAAYTLKEQGHVRVDIFYSRFTPKQQALVDLAGALIFLIPVCIFIIFSSWDYVLVAWRIKESSAEGSGLPFVYLLKASIWVLAGLIILQGIAESLRAFGKFLSVEVEEGK
jgi:TRAP-type mannitol/chloroaromatic compound transport system permease small subunit